MSKEIKGMFPVTLGLSYIVAIIMIVYAVMIYNYFFETIATVGMVLIIILAVVYAIVTTLLLMRNTLMEHIYIWIATLIGVVMLLVVLSQGFKMPVISVYGLIICIIFLVYNIFMHANYYTNREILKAVFEKPTEGNNFKNKSAKTSSVTHKNIKIKPNQKKKK